MYLFDKRIDVNLDTFNCKALLVLAVINHIVTMFIYPSLVIIYKGIR